MSGTDVLLIAALILGALAWFRSLPTYRYIGYGWVLSWYEGKVIVVSRLLDSPSGRAKVKIGSIILKFGDSDMLFASAADFREFMTTRAKPEIGQTERFTIDDGVEREVSLEAELIRGPIPIHKSLPPITDPADTHLYRHGMFYCRRTGQIVHTRSLSHEALDAMLDR